jgi:sec-independent protein translocase protein TatC
MMLGYWRYALVAIFVISAILTPPDMISMLLLAFPLTLLYVISVGVAWMFRIEPAEKSTAPTPKPQQPEIV